MCWRQLNTFSWEVTDVTQHKQNANLFLSGLEQELAKQKRPRGVSLKQDLKALNEKLSVTLRQERAASCDGEREEDCER